MIGDLLTNNLRWAAARTRAEPQYFQRLSRQQAPEYLWIGCSDSRVPANEIVGLDPGELFVHRNVANLAPPQDANCLSVIQFAVEILKVRHIIVCGHYGCGGVRAAINGERHGLIDHWLQPVRTLYGHHSEEFDRIVDTDARVNQLCERNVLQQVENLIASPFVQDAWRRKQPLQVHGWIYSIRDGLLRDLEVSVGDADAAAARLRAGADRAPRRSHTLKAPRNG